MTEQLSTRAQKFKKGNKCKVKKITTIYIFLYIIIKKKYQENQILKIN